MTDGNVNDPNEPAGNGETQVFKPVGQDEDTPPMGAPIAGAEASGIPSTEEMMEIINKKSFFDSPGNRIMFYVALGFAVLLIILIINRQVDQKNAANFEYKGPVKTVTEQPVVPEPVTSTELPIKVAPPKITVPTDDLSGLATFEVKEGGPVLSEEADPQFVALANALKNRIVMLYPTNTRKRRTQVIETTTGNFQGLKVTITRVKQPEIEDKEEILVVTPTKGSFLVKDNKLDSVKETDLQKILQDMEEAGLGVKKTTLAEGVNIQLEVKEYRGKLIEERFLIENRKVGPIELDMDLITIKSLLPNQYTLVEKTIEHEEKYFDTIKVLDRRNNGLFFINARNNRVWGLQVLNRQYKTSMGLGIGNTLGDCRIYYKGLKIWQTDGSAPLLSVNGIEGVFILQTGKIDFEKGIYPDNTVINSILLGGSPYLN